MKKNQRDLDDRFDFILVGNTDSVLRNLPKGLKLGGFTVLTIGTSEMHIMRSSWIDARIEMGSNKIDEFVDELLTNAAKTLKFSGTYLWSSDEIMHKIAMSNCSMDLKTKILPFGNPNFFDMLNSKVGQDRIFKALNIATPNGYSLESHQTTPENGSTKLSGPILIKKSSSSGGQFISEISDIGLLDFNKIPKDWFPLLIQEKREGIIVSVECFYRDGELKLWLYSNCELYSSKYGPSIIRNYTIPRQDDFLKYLEILGKNGKISGFVNCSLIYNPITMKHEVIEFDARPNVWHQIFLDLNIDFKRFWDSNSEVILQEPHYVNKMFYEPNRLFTYSAINRRFFIAILILKGHTFKKFGAPITSDFLELIRKRERRLRILRKIFKQSIALF